MIRPEQVLTDYLLEQSGGELRRPIHPCLHVVIKRNGRTFAVLNDFLTWVGSVAVLPACLELLAIIVIFGPDFWRR